MPTKVKLKLDIRAVVLNINTAISLGLIVNELVSNSFKHAFPGQRKGNLEVYLGKSDREEDDNYLLIISDNGIGIPESVDVENSGNLGMLIVYSMVKKLHGILELDRKGGTKFTIKFRELK
jgi:two-component sensor histidine kinase